MKVLFILSEQDSAFDAGVPKGILYVRRRDHVVRGGGRGRGHLSRSVAAGGFLVPSFSTNSGQFVFSSLFGIHPNNDRCFVNHGTRHVYVLSIFDFAVSLLIKRTRRSFCKSSNSNDLFTSTSIYEKKFEYVKFPDRKNQIPVKIIVPIPPIPRLLQ